MTAQFEQASEQAVAPGDPERRQRLLRFLSEEWLAERLATASQVVPAEGVDMVIQHVVLGGPDGAVHYVDVIEDGLITQTYLGRHESPHVTITNIWTDEIGVLRGDVDVFDVIIEGRLKVTGNQALLLRVIPVLQHPVTERMVRELAELTLA